MIAHGKQEQLLHRVDEAFQAFLPRSSFTIAEGTHQDGPVGAPPPPPHETPSCAVRTVTGDGAQWCLVLGRDAPTTLGSINICHPTALHRLRRRAHVSLHPPNLVLVTALVLLPQRMEAPG